MQLTQDLIHQGIGYPSMVYGTQGNVTTTNKLPKHHDLGNVHTWWAWVQKEDLECSI
jgi:hypothetical protein